MILDYQEYWENGFTWQDYLEHEVENNEPLWNGVFRRSRVPDWAVKKARDLGGERKLLALTEDWCGDASNTLPVIARLAEAASNVDLRLVKRDESPKLMDQYLTNGSRSLPKVIVLDEDFIPVDSWGPRPGELQEFVLREKHTGVRPVGDIYRDTRRWYARDRGETTLRELLQVMESASRYRLANKVA